jgi:Bacterial cadherin-like domain
MASLAGSNQWRRQVTKTFDVVTNFNNTGTQPEPGNPFTYGTEPSLNTGFTLFPNFQANGTVSVGSGQFTTNGTLANYYISEAISGPSVGEVATGGPLSFSGAFTVPNGVLMMMPGDANVGAEIVVTRFTAPEKGIFDLTGSFTNLESASVSLAIVVDGITEFTGGFSAQQTIPFSISDLHLALGATVDFIVDSLGNRSNDVVGLTAQITEVAVPPTANPDFTHVIFGRHGQQDIVAAPGVLANDILGTSGDTLTVSAVNGNAAKVGQAVGGHYGSLQLFGDGHFIYTASQHSALPSSGVSEDFFGYTALEGGSGGGGSASSTLTVVVTAPGLTYLGGQAGQTIQGPNGHSPVLDGSAGNDILLAGKGATVLVGGNGDTLTGNKAADTFVFMGQFGQNMITNFDPKHDIIQLDHNEFANLNAVMHAAVKTASGTVITDPTNSADKVTLVGVDLASLHFDATHFLLA